MDGNIDPQTWSKKSGGRFEKPDSRGPSSEPEEKAILSFSDNPNELKRGQYLLPEDGVARPRQLASSGFNPYRYDYKPAVWGACGRRSDDLKVARRFTRANISSEWEGKYAYMNCGQYNGNGFGFNHILKRHSDDYERKAAYVGSSQWRHAADFAMFGTLKYPQYVRYDSDRGTYCLNRCIYVYVGKKQVNKFKGMVAIGETGRRIMTSYPASGWCSKSRNETLIYDTRP